MFLVNHNQDHSLPLNNVLNSNELEATDVWMNHTIVILGAVLILGGLFALANKISLYARNNQWKQPKLLSLDQAFASMQRNSQKAIIEHIEKHPTSKVYATVAEALPSVEAMKKENRLAPLAFSHSAEAEKGLRENMEDAHFYQETSTGVITGVFDGHSMSEPGVDGAAVAKLASQIIQANFFDRLKKNNNNVRLTFELLFNEIQQQIIKNKNFDDIGATAVVSFVDKKTNLIYTATLGDSEANIYRVINQQLKSIPLSCVRDWSCLKDDKRAGTKLVKSRYGPKNFRYKGLNVSRAFGDVYTSGFMDKSAIIHKPKITVNQLRAGDVFILACDGLKDYVPEQEVVQVLNEHQTNQAKPLVDWALKDSKDNVTVVAVTVSQ